jgi:hypothetical protein
MEFFPMHSIVQGFATFGGFLFSICIVAAGVVGCLISTGIFMQLFGPAVFKANEDKSISFGMKAGALLGLVWSVTAIYQLGNMSAIFSLLGLCVVLLSLAFLTWFISDSFKTRPRREFD